MNAGRYVRRPAVVEAFRLGHHRFPAWFASTAMMETVTFRDDYAGNPVAASAEIPTRHGPHLVRRGEWIVRAHTGALSWCSDFTFMAAYQAAPAQDDAERETGDVAMGTGLRRQITVDGKPLSRTDGKRCIGCGFTKPRTDEYFHQSVQKGTGYRAFAPRCRECSPEPREKQAQPSPNERRFEIELARLESEVGPYSTWRPEHHELLTERIYQALKWNYDRAPGDGKAIEDPGSPFFRAMAVPADLTGAAHE